MVYQMTTTQIKQNVNLIELYLYKYLRQNLKFGKNTQQTTKQNKTKSSTM